MYMYKILHVRTFLYWQFYANQLNLEVQLYSVHVTRACICVISLSLENQFEINRVTLIPNSLVSCLELNDVYVCIFISRSCV